MIQRGRPQVGGDPLHRREADLDQTDQRLDAIDRLTVDPLLPQRARRPRQLELDGGQCLAELIVQLAREAGPLLLAGRLDPRRQLTQLFLGLLQPQFLLRHLSWFLHEIGMSVHALGRDIMSVEHFRNVQYVRLNA